PDAAIRDADHAVLFAVIIGFASDRDHDIATVRAELDRVAEQVPEDPPEPEVIPQPDDGLFSGLQADGVTAGASLGVINGDPRKRHKIRRANAQVEESFGP